MTRGPRPHQPPPARKRALELYWEEKKNVVRAAKRLLKDKAVFTGTLAAARLLVSRCAARWDESGSIEDKPRGGRPRRCKQPAAKRALELLYQPSDLNRSYTSFRDAISKCPELSAIVDAAGGCWRTVWRAIVAEARRQGLPLQRVRYRLRPRLSAWHKGERLRVSLCFLADPQDAKRRHATIWLDACKIYAVPPCSRLVYTLKRGRELVVEHPALSSSGGVVVCNYYAAVCSAKGPVYFSLMPGTTGFQHTDKVRRGPSCNQRLLPPPAAKRSHSGSTSVCRSRP